MFNVHKVAIGFLINAAIAYLTLGAFFYLRQSVLIFPAPKTFAQATPADRGISFRNLRIPVAPNHELHAWWIPSTPPSDKAILVFHGNGYVLENMVAAELPSLLDIGANLLLIDYRGYGSSSEIAPSEATVNADAEAALAWLLGQPGMQAGSVFLLGRSVGSGPATNLASKYSGLAGLILESPFSSLDDAAAGSWIFRLYPVSFMLHTHFDNLSKMGAVRAPVLIVSGTGDRLTPKWMAEALFARARQPKQLYLVPGADHNNLLALGGQRLVRVTRNLIGKER